MAKDGIIMALPFPYGRLGVAPALAIIPERLEGENYLRDLVDREPDLQATSKQKDHPKVEEVSVAKDGIIMALPFRCVPQEVERVLVTIQERLEEVNSLRGLVNKEPDLPETLKQKDLIREAEVSVANDGTITALPFRYGRLEVEPALAIIQERLEEVNFLQDLANKEPDLPETLKRKGQTRVAEA